MEQLQTALIKGFPPQACKCSRSRYVQLRQTHAARSASKRQEHDPDKFSSYDEVREHLHAEAKLAGLISSTLNLLSQSAFGDSNRGGRTFGGGLYRGFLKSKWASGLLSNLSMRPGYQAEQHVNDSAVNSNATAEANEAHPGQPVVATQTERTRQQFRMLLGCDSGTIASMARRWPPFLKLDPETLQQHLMILKDEMPNVNVADIVRQYPRAFLNTDHRVLRAVVSANVRVLQEGLRGADVDAMTEQDPLLVLQEPQLLKEGIEQMRQLWNVEADALADSDPWKLTLAVRAMTKSATALPRRL